MSSPTESSNPHSYVEANVLDGRHQRKVFDPPLEPGADAAARCEQMAKDRPGYLFWPVTGRGEHIEAVPLPISDRPQSRVQQSDEFGYVLTRPIRGGARDFSPEAFDAIHLDLARPHLGLSRLTEEVAREILHEWETMLADGKGASYRLVRWVKA